MFKPFLFEQCSLVQQLGTPVNMDCENEDGLLTGLVVSIGGETVQHICEKKATTRAMLASCGWECCG